MTWIFFLFCIGTSLFVMTMIRQFQILAKATERDPNLQTKLLFFLFSLFKILTTATLLFAFFWDDEDLLTPAMFFYIGAGAISFWTYYHHQKPKPPKI